MARHAYASRDAGHTVGTMGLQVCYDCLRVFAPAQRPLEAGGQAYCGQPCADRAGGSYAGVEGRGGEHFAALSQHCSRFRERFPLLAARLACGIVQNGRSDAYRVHICQPNTKHHVSSRGHAHDAQQSALYAVQ